MRSKEEAHDYRYFPDPDLPLMVIDESVITNIKSALPELPWLRKQRLINDFKLQEDEAEYMVESSAYADYYESMVKQSGDLKQTTRWVIRELGPWLRKERKQITDVPFSTDDLLALIERCKDQTLNQKNAKIVFDCLIRGERDVDQIIESQSLKQMNDDGALESIVDEVFARSASQIQQYKDGNDKIIGYFVGQIMRASKGSANPQQVNALIKAKLDES